MFALGPNVFVDPFKICFIVRKAADKIPAWHAGLPHTHLHDTAFLAANIAYREPKIYYQCFEQLWRQFEFHEFVGKGLPDFLCFFVPVAVFADGL